MKYSFMSFSTPALSLAEMLDLASRLGYDAIEPRLDSKHAHGIEITCSAAERTAIAREVQSSGVKLCCLATSIKYSNPAATDETLQQTIERIDLAADLSVPAIRVFGGKIPEGITREATADLLVSSLAKVAGHAADQGVAVCMETHDDWCDPANVAAVLARVDHPAIACNWDIMHPVRAGGATMDQAFAALKPWVKHLHIHDGREVTVDGKTKNELVPIGTGIIDHRRALELLKTINYDGYISGEWINWEPFETHLPRELATMKRYETELGI